jgi:2-keto-myo-inositol isomerase
LDSFPIERLALVHLNDAPEKPPRQIEDEDRVLPGEGVIQLKGLIAALKARRFTGPWSLETFNPRYWREAPDDIARRGYAATDALFAEG